MAPPGRPPPPVQLRMALAACRERGYAPELAWKFAMKGRLCRCGEMYLNSKACPACGVDGVRLVIWPHDTQQRREWVAAAEETKAEWLACYVGEETETARVVDVFVASLTDDPLDRDPELERVA